MGFFKNRAVAVILAVIIIPLAVLLNVRVKLGAECRSVEDTFYVSAGSGAKCIYHYLDSRLDAANGLWTLAEQSGADGADELAAARQALLDAYEAKDIGAMYDANSRLETAFAAVETALEDSDGKSSYVTTFDGAQKMIDESGYNAGVYSFRTNTLERFPADLLASIAGVEGPTAFE